jgi:hypothetical protein
MRFDARELKPYSEPVSASDLREGAVYFSVGFLDEEEMHLPVVEPLVFIGKDLNPGDQSVFYFQDAPSYRRGIRYQSATDSDGAKFYEQPSDRLGFVFEFEHALDLLLACSLRRRAAGQT